MKTTSRDNSIYEILALIPARSGSKSIPDKNIREIAGKPLLAYSIGHALNSTLITRTIVSTDSPSYAEIARNYGAETPFLRPAEFAQDASTDLEVFIHALTWLAENEGYVPDICVHLRPTHPVRRVEDIDKMIRILLENNEFDSVRSVVPAPETPFKMWFRSDDGLLSPVMQTTIHEAYNLPRQAFPKTFMQNASVDVVRTKVITDLRSMTGRRIYGYMMHNIFDIDTELQLKAAAEYLRHCVIKDFNRQSKTDEARIFCFDIDGVIATIVPANQYDRAEPLPENIQLINCLYGHGHRIILFTARGSATGLDWKETTREQLERWGVKYHQLLFGKPAADYYIDDKFVSIEKIHEMISINKKESIEKG